MPLPFAEICTLLSRLEDIETNDPPFLHDEKYKRAKGVIESWFKSHLRQINELTIDGATALLSTLLPEWRTDRVYGIQSQNLYRIVCRSLRLGRDSISILGKYKEPGFGDIGTCLDRVLKDLGPPGKPPLMLEQVDDMLQMLAGGNRHSSPSILKLPPSSSEQRDQTISNILKRCDWDKHEGKWLARLILKHFSPVLIDEKLVLKNFHFILPDLLNFQRDFHAAATLLKGELREYPCRPDPMSERLHKKGVADRMRPVVGTKIGRPKFDIARDVNYLLKTLAGKEWALERKYDGEYCEIHVDLQRSRDLSKCITIFAKSGKDSTQDKKGLHDTIIKSLRLGQPDCRFQRRAILLGEMIVFSDKDDEILPFEKIRKHVPRSGRHIGTDMDSQPQPWEHLAIVYFDLLLLDDEVVMDKPVDERRTWLHETYSKMHGRAMGAERKNVDFSDIEAGEEKLLQQFAAAIARRTEGLVLKPLDMPYFTLQGQDCENRFIKLKKDFLKGMGDEADFAVIGASYNAQQAATSRLKAVKWTTFHFGCLTNPEEVRRMNARPNFKYVGSIDQDKCIPKAILEAANTEASFRAKPYDRTRQPEPFDVQSHQILKMDVVLSDPLVFELLGSGFEKPSNCEFLMLRHPRVKKMHEDRSWLDCVTFKELQQQGRAARESPVDSESQEARKWLERLESLVRKHERKAERQRTATPGSVKTTSPTALRRMKSPSKPPARRVVNQLPTPMPSSGVERLLSSSPVPRVPSLVRQGSSKRQHDEDISGPNVSKKPRLDSAERTPDNDDGSRRTSPLAELTSNTDPPSAREASRQNQRSRALSELTRKVAAIIRPSRMPDEAPSQETQSSHSAPTHDCEGNRCPFSAATVYLVPCISKALYISEDLLRSHNIVPTSDLSHWDRNSFAHAPHGAIVSESQSHPGMRKIVLVERKRRAAVKAIVQKIQKLNRGRFRERIDVYDWRVLEECKKHDRGEDTIKKHFIGATMFDDTRKKALFVANCEWL